MANVHAPFEVLIGSIFALEVAMDYLLAKLPPKEFEDWLAHARAREASNNERSEALGEGYRLTLDGFESIVPLVRRVQAQQGDSEQLAKMLASRRRDLGLLAAGGRARP